MFYYHSRIELARVKHSIIQTRRTLTTRESEAGRQVKPDKKHSPLEQTEHNEEALHYQALSARRIGMRFFVWAMRQPLETVAHLDPSRT